MRQRLALVLVALCSGLQLTVAAAAAAADAQDVDWGPLPEPPVVERLDNQLQLVAVPWPSPGIVAYHTLVRVGSRDEVEPGHSGFAHLFEHMMFRGTERHPEEEYEQLVQSFGADNNAYTTRDYTLYTVTVANDALDDLIALEADRFQHLSYDESQFRTETGAVLGEYNKSAASPFLPMWEALNELAFSRHTYGHTTLGYLKDIQAMPGYFDYSKAFFERFYTPDNTTLIVVGDFDLEELRQQVREHYGDWRGRRDDNPVPAEPPPEAGGERHIRWEGRSEPRMLLAYRTPAFGDASDAEALRDTAALEVLGGLLFSESSPLVQRLVIEQRKVLELGSWSQDFSRDPELFVVSARLLPGLGFDALTRQVQEAIDAVAAGDFEVERLNAVRSHLRYASIMDVQTPEDAAEMLAQFLAVSGSIRALPAYLAALRQVTPEDVQRVAQKYLRPERRFVVTLAPEEPSP